MFIGIPAQEMQKHFAYQEHEQYCWAACIQMVLSFYGEERAQSDIDVRGNGFNLFGWFPDRSGNRFSIENNFNELFVSRFHCSSGDGAIDLGRMLDELDSQKPIIAGYSEDPQSHHAVVIFGAEYNQIGGRTIVGKIHVADPFPGRGFISRDAGQFIASMSAHWFIQKYY